MIDFTILSLICLFAIIIGMQLVKKFTTFKEGIDDNDSHQLSFHKYVKDGEKDKKELADKNALNIQFIIQKLAKLGETDSKFVDLSGNVSDLNGQVQQLVQSQKDYTQQTTPSSPPIISGT